MSAEVNQAEQAKAQGELLVAIYIPDVRRFDMPVFEYYAEKNQFIYERLDDHDLSEIYLAYDVDSVLGDEEWLVFLVTGNLMNPSQCKQRAISKEEAKKWLRKEFVKHATR